MQYHVICFAPTDWWGMNPSCATHYMHRFSEHTKVLYVNPFSSDISGIKKGLLRRIPRKMKSLMKFIRNPQKNLYVFSPLFFPLQGISGFDSINNYFLRTQLKLAMRIAGIGNKPLIWLENPRAIDMLDFIDHSKVVYHVSDYFVENRYIKNKKQLEERENQCTRNSDLIVAVSKSLYQWKQRHPNLQYLPHGVDFSEFRRAVEDHNILEALRDIPRPIIGYYGTLSSSNDIEMWEYCAKKLIDCSFVFAGKVTGGDYSRLFSLPNVYHLGMLPYKHIPNLCAGFDVCMLQWKMTPWIAACNPLKTMEYMASGKPIVSVPIKYIQDTFGDVVSIASTKEDFATAIQWELVNDTPQRVSKRIEIASSCSWESNFSKVCLWINEAMGIDG